MLRSEVFPRKIWSSSFGVAGLGFHMFAASRRERAAVLVLPLTVVPFDILEPFWKRISMRKFG